MSVYALIIVFAVILALVRHRLRSASPVRQAMRAYVQRVRGMEVRTPPAPFSNNRYDPERERRFHVRVDEIVIELRAWVGEEQETFLEVKADLAIPPGPAFKVSKGGEELPPSELDEPWKAAVAVVGRLTLRSNGDSVAAHVGYPLDVDGVAAVANLVARVARRDGGLGDTLLAMPGATPLTGHALVPGVVLDADGLVIGVRNRSQVVAQLDDVTHVGPLPGPTQELVARAGDGELLVTGNGARFTWKGIERDPARLRAGVDALRSLRGASGPYR